MNNIILDGFTTDELVLALDTPHLSLLAMELNHTYGLKAFRVVDSGRVTESHHIYMSRDDGAPVCKIYISVSNDKPTFNYYSTHYSKARGRDDKQRHTIQSNKLSTLMGTLKAKKVVPSANKVMDVLSNQAGSMMGVVRRTIGGSTSKSLYGFDAEAMHQFLKAVLAGDSKQDLSKLDLTPYKNLLKEFDDVDAAKKKQEDKVQEIFKGKYHVVGVDSSGEYLVGTFQYEEDKGLFGGQALRPFKRFKNFLDCGNDDLIPTMLMFKTMLTNSPYNTRNTVGSDIPVPIVDAFVDEMDVVLYYPGSPSDWHFQWLLTPAS